MSEIEIAGKIFDHDGERWHVRDNRHYVENEMTIEVLDRIKGLEDMLEEACEFGIEWGGVDIDETEDLMDCLQWYKERNA